MTIVNGLVRRALLRTSYLEHFEKKAARATSKKFRRVTSVNGSYRPKTIKTANKSGLTAFSQGKSSLTEKVPSEKAVQMDLLPFLREGFGITC